MENLKSIREKALIKASYNEEPVFYCKHCLSLKVRTYNDIIDYCDDCGSTTIEKTNITSWEKMYKEKYNNTLI